MTTADYPALHRHLVGTIGELHQELPGPLRGYLQLHAAATEDGALTKKTKELLALAISICVHCDGCIAYHTHDALSAGASREEILDTIGVAIMMGGGPAVVFGAQAYEALGQFESESPADTMTAPTPSSYTVRAETIGDGTSVASCKQTQIAFDSSPLQSDTLPGPADLLTAAFAACVLKNVERMGEILTFRWEHAAITVTSQRQDAPPKMTRFTYRLELTTDELPHRLELLHANIRKHGTVYNTLAAVCEVTGELVAIGPASTQLHGPE